MPVDEAQQIAKLRQYQAQFPKETREIFDNMQTAFVDKVSEIFISPKGVLEGRNCFGKTMAKYDCTRPAINHQTEESEKN